MKTSPLRLAAIEFAFIAGYPVHHTCEFKLRENRSSPKNNPSYDILVKEQGAKKSKCIGAIMLHAVYPH